MSTRGVEKEILEYIKPGECMRYTFNVNGVKRAYMRADAQGGSC